MASRTPLWPSSPVFLICCVLIAFAAPSSYPTYYLDDYCYDGLSRTLQLEASGPHSSFIIRISRKGGYKTDMKCSLTLKPPYGGHDDEDDDDDDRVRQFGLVLSVDKINLRKNPDNLFCLDVFKVSHKDRRTWIADLYGCWTNLTGKSVVSDPIQDDPELKLDFKSFPIGSNPEKDYDLEITVTAFSVVTTKGCDAVSKDNRERYSCTTGGRCIWQGLTCDLRNNCGDDSDERNCDRIGNEVLTGVSVGVGLLAVGLICVLCCWRRKRKPPLRECEPTAPLLANTDDPRSQSTSYGSSEVPNTQPPPYEYQTPYNSPPPPPPPYKE